MSDEPEVLWKGTQWQVTSRGVDEIAAAQAYWIEVSDLDKGFNDPEAGWPAHVATKVWVDFDEFVQAYLIACVVHGVRIARIGELVDAGYRRRSSLNLPTGSAQ